MKTAKVRLMLKRFVSSDKYAVIDSDLIDAVMMVGPWYLHTPPRSRTHYAIAHSRGKRFRLHRLVIGDPAEGMEIDHINGDGLDNRRENLRFVSHSENMTMAHRLHPFKLRGGSGVNRVIKRLSDGSSATYYYHKPTRTKLPGAPGEPDFEAALERILR
ncbi:endonuclease [EBPR podovirus 2]|nr:endonuclease [EBPR podovirus 2]